MASHNEKTSLPVADQPLGLTMPEKASLSKESDSTIQVLALDKSTNLTGTTTPRSDTSNPFETDIEAMITTTTTNKSRCSVILNRKNDCEVWPGKRDWKQRAKADKRKKRNCAFIHNLSRRNRILVKVLILILVVGGAVAVGFGVSKPLGAPIWGDNNKNSGSS